MIDRYQVEWHGPMGHKIMVSLPSLDEALDAFNVVLAAGLIPVLVDTQHKANRYIQLPALLTDTERLALMQVPEEADVPTVVERADAG